MPIFKQVKNKIMKKRTGIWLDFNEASIIELKDDETEINTILSDIEHYNPKGGARSKTPFGPMDKISESKYLERRKHQEKNYYRKLMNAVQHVDELFIFGPAEAKDRLLKAIKTSNVFHPSLKGIERADSMTENQKIAKAKLFFQNI